MMIDVPAKIVAQRLGNTPKISTYNVVRISAEEKSPPGWPNLARCTICRLRRRVRAAYFFSLARSIVVRMSYPRLADHL
jgi:hypothetical protein